VIREITERFVPAIVKLPAALLVKSAENDFFQFIYSSRKRVDGLAVLDLRTGGVAWLGFWREGDELATALRAAAEKAAQVRPLKPPTVPPPHAKGDPCPLNPEVPAGWLVADLLGRLDSAVGAPELASQKNYAHDRFALSPDVQELVAKTLSGAKGSVRVPHELAHQLALRAYLGQSELRPLDNPHDANVDLRTLELRARPVGEGRFRIEGASEVATDGEVDGIPFTNHVDLTWEGWLALDGARITRLALRARGRARLRWAGAAGRNDRPYLLTGPALKVDGPVTFGVLAPAAGRVLDFGQGGAPKWLHERAQKLYEGMARWHAAGRDLAPIHAVTRDFGPRLSRGEFKEAGAVLDRALEQLSR
jgi:hypothetical protein